MMGIPVYEPAFVFSDYQSVLANTSVHMSPLKKKSNTTAFYLSTRAVPKCRCQLTSNQAATFRREVASITLAVVGVLTLAR